MSILVLAATATSQDVVWTMPGIPDDHRPWGNVIRTADLDGDGRRDVLIRALDWFPGDPSSASTVTAVSSADGRTLRVDRQMPTWWWGFRRINEAGDVDRDGVPDYVRSQGDGNAINVEVRSGATGSVVWSVATSFPNYASSLAGDLDLNGDGRPDLLVATATWSPSDPNWPGYIDAFDHTGQSLYRIRGYSPWGDRPMAGVGDLDGDGCDDFITMRTDVVLGSEVRIYSGRSGALLRSLPGTQYYAFAGSYNWAMRCGDLDGDGRDDFAVSSSGYGTLADAVLLGYSSATGQLVLVRREAYPTDFGIATVVSDCDLDGVSDFLVGRPATVVGTSVVQGGIDVVSGRDGTTFCELRPPSPAVSSRLGQNDAAVVDPLPGDVFPTIIASEPDWIPPQQGSTTRLGAIGRLSCFRPVPSSVRAFGDGCAGALAGMPGIGFRVTSTTTARVHLTGAVPGGRAFFVVGLSDQMWGTTTLPYDLTGVGMPGCELNVAFELAVDVQAGTAGLDRGYAFVDVPRAPVTLFGQWLVLDGAGGVAMSKALRW